MRGHPRVFTSSSLSHIPSLPFEWHLPAKKGEDCYDEIIDCGAAYQADSGNGSLGEVIPTARICHRSCSLKSQLQRAASWHVTANYTVFAQQYDREMIHPSSTVCCSEFKGTGLHHWQTLVTDCIWIHKSGCRSMFLIYVNDDAYQRCIPGIVLMQE